MTDIKNIDRIVCDWAQIYRNELDRTVKMCYSIIDNGEIIDFSDKYFAGGIVDDWAQVCQNEIERSAKHFCSIINSGSVVDVIDRYFSGIDISNWVEWHNILLEDERKHEEDGRNFNVFYLFEKELRVRVIETMHSRLLKFLLDPHGSHGQGNKFLMKFLELRNVLTPEEGKWSVSVETGNIDILLKRIEPVSVIVIENKSHGAKDQDNQLYRYWFYAIHSMTGEISEKFYIENESRYQLLYLVSNKKPMHDNQTIERPDYLFDTDMPEIIPIKPEILRFDDFIQQWLDKCIDCIPETNHIMRGYIKQYKNLCKSL